MVSPNYAVHVACKSNLVSERLSFLLLHGNKDSAGNIYSRAPACAGSACV